MDRSTNKFLDIEHEWMPPAIQGWRAAMDDVDKGRTSRPTVRAWGYWVPDPAIFLRAHKERADRYFATWLRVRPGWMYMLRVRDAELSAIPMQWWRDFLYGETGRQDRDETTANAQRARQIMHVFRHAFEAEEVDMNPTVPPLWFGRRYSTIPDALYPQIVWELHELGFRQELLALDRLLVPARPGEGNEDRREDMLGRIFPDRSLYGVKELPSRNSAGLGALVPHARAPFLEAFRAVLSRWPKRPACIYLAVPITTNLTSEEIVRREGELARFYITTFYETSGRAPIVPRTFATV